MLYLKHRPQTIADLDSTNVRTVLANILNSVDLPHALLFVGQKGMGKTSAARVFAKAINCLNNTFAQKQKSYEPCNTCDNCLAITKSQSPDIVEMDAASNRGIDEIRTIIREAHLAPLYCRYRVYIIDEAHMITTEGFNALLKTLEEPPEKTIFILATTNEEKLPKTIISRTTRVNFGRATIEDLKNMVSKVATRESISIDAPVIDLIADNSDYSFRDGIKLLEELMTQKKLDFTQAEEYIGARSGNKLLELIQGNDVEKSIEWLQTFQNQSGNVKKLLEELMVTLQKRLIATASKNKSLQQRNSFSLKEISMLLKYLNEAYGNLKNTPIEIIPLEIALIDFYNFRHTIN